MVIKFQSWGRIKTSSSQSFYCYDQALLSNLPILSVGSCKSYGDSCLNDGGAIINNLHRDAILNFDQQNLTIEVETGITLQALLNFLVPKGFFLPVVPGTLDITVGGAIANDIHGKNHHLAGTFGQWVHSFKIKRENKLINVDRQNNSSLFCATIGGLGLTGHIESCVLMLRKVESSYIDGKVIKFVGLQSFLKLCEQYRQTEYSVAWIDTSYRGSHCIRGHFILGEHAHDMNFSSGKKRRITIPPFVPKLLLSNFTLKLFNWLYYHRKIRRVSRFYQNYQDFFCPLDSLKKWNRLYGSKGPWQFQCVLPHACAEQAIAQIFEVLKKHHQLSFLAVLKQFGAVPSSGLLSFPCDGITLALDFADCGDKTLHLLHELYMVTIQNSGRIYPAKDCLLTYKEFVEMYPNYQSYMQHLDSRFQSDWWKRAGSPQ